eukprot:CAMPEP_0181179228 /NCGR_PEP_ID=MMETSP1096-20121128/6146_2 /TAXON_ID=156174 ORGANISM="Chrysochromulina ericina, Strain CCMP281" /NCGR_SAMPLE_ID=MMETSP1096 /ASSEMBLY_ACC=CAM_ASM_000453 /LENGTH=119 /DNA_ID=CAMNT_0023267559 /DNA_START=234 /DNA_END=589 /DNA_ORIENTATION=-
MARPQHPSRKRAAAREGGRDIGVDDDELMAACREDGVYQIRAEGVDDPIAHDQAHRHVMRPRDSAAAIVFRLTAVDENGAILLQLLRLADPDPPDVVHVASQSVANPRGCIQIHLRSLG